MNQKLRFRGVEASHTTNQREQQGLVRFYVNFFAFDSLSVSNMTKVHFVMKISH